MRERYSFRFTHDEIAEMRRISEGHRHSRPSQAELNGLASSFSNVRRQQGMTFVRVESVQSWFKRNRQGYSKSSRGRPRVRSKKPKTSTLADQPLVFTNQKLTANEETSEKSSSEEESSEEEMSESRSTDTEEGRSEPNIQYNDVSYSTECMDVSLQAIVPQQGPLSEVDSVLARLARFKKVQSEAGSKLNLSKPTDSNTLSMVGHARATLEKLKGLSLVEFRMYEKDFKFAIQILLDEGGLLSETEKAEFPLLPDKLRKIAQENERVRKELADCRAFMEKLQECRENTIKLMEKAKILEEKYNTFPKNMSTLPNKVAGLEAALLVAKAQAEKIKGDEEDVATELARVAECLQSASTHHKILKAEEVAVLEKKIKLTECLQKNTEEWVTITNPKTFTLI